MRRTRASMAAVRLNGSLPIGPFDRHVRSFVFAIDFGRFPRDRLRGKRSRR